MQRINRKKNPEQRRKKSGNWKPLVATHIVEYVIVPATRIVDGQKVDRNYFIIKKVLKQKSN